MSDNGQGPKSGKVVGNGLRMVARGCQGSPELPVDLKRGLQTTPGPGGAANGQIRRNRGPHIPYLYGPGYNAPIVSTGTLDTKGVQD